LAPSPQSFAQRYTAENGSEYEVPRAVSPRDVLLFRCEQAIVAATQEPFSFATSTELVLQHKPMDWALLAQGLAAQPESRLTTITINCAAPEATAALEGSLGAALGGLHRSSTAVVSLDLSFCNLGPSGWF
jgi:hypothetical protein